MHQINYLYYDEKIDKTKVKNEADSIAGRNGDSGELHHPIRWIDKTLDNENEAIEYINSIDNGWYDNIAVKFLDYSKIKSSPKVQKAREKVAVKNKSYNEKIQKTTTDLLNAKSTYIGCKECGSSLSRKHLHNHYCPLCNNDLFSNTVKESIEKSSNAITEAEKALKNAIKEHERNAKKKAVTKWLVKIEYSC